MPASRRTIALTAVGNTLLCKYCCLSTRINHLAATIRPSLIECSQTTPKYTQFNQYPANILPRSRKMHVWKTYQQRTWNITTYRPTTDSRRKDWPHSSHSHLWTWMLAFLDAIPAVRQHTWSNQVLFSVNRLSSDYPDHFRSETLLQNDRMIIFRSEHLLKVIEWLIESDRLTFNGKVTIPAFWKSFHQLNRWEVLITVFSISLPLLAISQ